MKQLQFLFCLICMGWTGMAFGQNELNTEAFSLKEAIKYAQDKSIEVKTARLEYSRSKQQVREYTSIGLPQVNGSVEYNYNINLPTQYLPDFITPAVVGTLESFQLVAPGTTENLPENPPQAAQFGVKNALTAGVSVSQLVFDGSYFVGLKAAKGLVQMTERQTDLSLHDIQYVIKNTYLTVLIARENQKVLLNNIDNLQKLRDETNAFFESGLVEQLDVDRIDLNLANLKSELDIVNRQVETAHNVLKFQMNYPIEESIELTDSLQALLEEPSEDELSGDINISNRIELDILEQNMYLNELNMKRHKMGYLPSLSAFFSASAQLQRNDLFDNDEAGFTPITITGATLKVPIFDGFNKDAKIQMAKIDQSKIGLQIKQFKLATTLEVTNARANYVNAKQRLDNQDKNLKLAERILNTTKIKYKEGVGSSMEITTAEQELYRTQGNYMNALYDVVVAKTNLDKALGNDLMAGEE